MGQVGGSRCLINYGWHTLWVGGGAHTGVELGPSSTQGRTTGWLGEEEGPWGEWPASENPWGLGPKETIEVLSSTPLPIRAWAAGKRKEARSWRIHRNNISVHVLNVNCQLEWSLDGQENQDSLESFPSPCHTRGPVPSWNASAFSQPPGAWCSGLPNSNIQASRPAAQSIT